MTGPSDIVMALPVSHLPRVGKVRSGIKKDHTKTDGELIQLPSAVDYFVVNHDKVTNRQSAESFAQRFGPEPRELPITLPAPTVDEVFAGAWRRYRGGEVLERKCTGPGGTCVVRGPEGEWVSGACQCERDGLDPERDKEPKKGKPGHCQKRWTLNFLLMDVSGLGVWQFDTGSIIAAGRISSTLLMIEQFRGHLQGAECVLRLVPQKVAPKGRSKTVYVAELGAGDVTPAQALALAAAPRRVELPPSSLDEAPDALLDHESFQIADATPAPREAESRMIPGQPVASVQEPAGHLGPPAGSVIDSVDAAKSVIRSCDGAQRSKLLRLLGFQGPAQMQQLAQALYDQRKGRLAVDVLEELPA